MLLVLALNACGGGGGSADTTPPGAVTGLSASAAGQSQINLNWVAATDDVTVQSSLVYEVCQSSSPSGCDAFTVSATTGAGATAYNATGLSPSATY